MEEKEKKIPLVKRPTTYKLVIPADVEKKIRHLCNRVSEVEWSGILFYTYAGSMETNDLVITCKDIYVMDIGTGGYTEFDMSPEVMSYMCENPELLDVQCGLIHSHNKMSTFFSGTDTGTLQEEGSDRNHFVSLIVNNAGSYTAAITRKIKSTRTVSEAYSYGSFEDTVVEDTKQYTQEVEEIEYFYLTIEKEVVEQDFKDIDARLAEIRKRKAESAKPAASVGRLITTTTGFSNPNYRPLGVAPKVYQPSLFEEEMKEHIEKNGRISLDPNDDIPFTSYGISEKDVKSVVLQLITGSIIIKEESKIDIVKWVNSMPKIFGERFGVDEAGFKDFAMWADSYCEFLIFNKEPEIETGDEEAMWLSQFALQLHDELDALPKNRYIDELKSITEQWIM